ncbi:7727_t:CDS:2 [Cetraspora pellucida]|uniref:7727_t:CDS:1 n=1 Tax=Cetraspora pellucida TaxID=1433469 RepID=A0ACA9KL84_9GLOM|nr:7727_t:CDS:2 [Cetraspora pellucida]
MKNLIVNCFESKEHDHAYFLGILKFDEDFVNMHNENQESDKKVTYHNIAESFLIQPSFILTDKDAKCAIERKLKKKKYKASQYTQQVANNAKSQFKFIDEFWFPSEQENNICPKENIKEVLRMNKLIKFRKAELEEDKKVFESLITIVSDNIQNDYFYDVYVKLKRTLISETVACQEALRARRQQKTWDPPRESKLAFWLQ